MKLKGQTAFITGSAQGIGKAISQLLAQEGANIVVSDVNLESASATAQEIKSNFLVEAIAIKCNVAISAEVSEAFKKTIEQFGRIDILVNNAGITRDSLIMRMKDEDWDAVINVNLKGVFNGIKAVAPIMMKQKYGRIINIASIVGQMGNVGQANYSASKGGVIALTKTAARELASRGITVNAIAPGFIDTDMTKVLPEEVKAKLKEQIPMGILGTPQDIAKAVLFLSSDAPYITGQVIAVNGGMYM